MPLVKNSKAFWDEVLDGVAKRVNQGQFETWFSQTTCPEFSEDGLVIAVPNTFYSAWLKKQYLGIIQGCVKDATGVSDVNVEFYIDESLKEETQIGYQAAMVAQAGGAQGETRSLPTHPKAKPSSDVIQQLNADYTFENFIVGASNRMGHAAALAVIDDPGRVYTPLFIHGGLGLGKTHLLQGICHELLERRPDIQMAYVPCEKFINEFIYALEKNKINEFRERYRRLDVLVIDDIHFLANKDHTQEEFFHTFNCLYNDHKQIILSSDSPPKDIPTLEERLVSRFKWGLVCEVEPPTFEMRMGIIRKKSRMSGMELEDEVADFLASALKGSIRDLEGAVTRLVGYSRIMTETITVDLAKNVLRDLFGINRKRITIDEIIALVTDHYGVRLADLQSKKRFQSITLPRQVCMHLARKHTNHSLAEIGGYFGGRDHSTVLYGDEKICKRIETDSDLRRTVDEFNRRLCL